MKITKEEKQELQDFDIKLQSINDMYNRTVWAQEKWYRDRDEWFMGLRKKHKIPSTQNITIDPEGNITENKE